MEPEELEELPNTLDEREKRFRELVEKLSKPSGVGVVPPVAFIALGCTVALLYSMTDDFLYYFSSQEPIELGAEGDYRFKNLQSNCYAKVHGTPTGRGAYFQDSGKSKVAIGLQNTPMMVIRDTFPNEDFIPFAKAPQPDQRPFFVKGRLLSRVQASRFEAAFLSHSEWGEIHPTWVLMAEQRPGSDSRFMVLFTGLLLFGFINLWLFVRGILAFAKRKS